MDAQCTLSSDETGRVLDRLAALEQVIPPELVERAVAEAGLVQERSCRLTHEVMLWIVLAMGIYTDCPIRHVFRECRRFRKDDPIPTRSALCRARQRLGTHVLRRLYLMVVMLTCQQHMPGGFYKGYRLMGIDGSVFTTPDTPANERAFGRPKGGSSSESQGGFPQVGKVSLVEVGSHIEYRFVVRPCHRGEPTMAMRLVKHLTPEMLMLLDAGFYGYPLLRMIWGQRTHFLVNVASGPLLQPIRPLSDGSYLAKIYPTTRHRERDRGGFMVRVLKYTLDDPQRTGHGEVHRLVTTLLDEEQHPAQELIELYHERWELELTYREQKTHQDPRRASKPTHLRSETPAGVVQELYAISLSHFVVRNVMYDAACEAKLDPDRLSFVGAIRILRTRMPECPIVARPADIGNWYENLLAEIATETVEPRRNRINPRVIKRARCKWPTKKPEHYGQQPLRKSFAETVLII
jgi:hypothetical protein